MKTSIGQSKYRNLTLFHVDWSVPAKVFLTVTFSINKRLCKAWKFLSLLAGVVIKWNLGAIVASLSDKTQKSI